MTQSETKSISFQDRSLFIVLGVIAYAVIRPNFLLVGCFAFTGIQLMKMWFTRNILFPSVLGKYFEGISDKHKTVELLDKLLHHTLGFLFAVLACKSAFWCWMEHSFDTRIGCNVLQYEINLAYQYQFSYYCASLIYMAMLDSRAGEFSIMVIHHCVAMGLVYCSYDTGLSHAGIVIVAIHDGTDIFLYFAKLCRKTCLNLGTMEIISFLGLVISFWGARLIFLPYQLLKHIIVVGPQLETECVLYGLLLLLMYLQLRWGILMIKIVVDLLTGKGIKDPRERELSIHESGCDKKIRSNSDDYGNNNHHQTNLSSSSRLPTFQSNTNGFNGIVQ